MMNNQTSIVIGLPAFGGMTYSCLTRSLWDLRDPLLARGIVPILRDVPNCSILSAARAIPMTHWLTETDAEFYLSLDADQDFRPEQIIRLLDSGRDFALAPNPTKRLPPRWTGNLPPQPRVCGGFIELLDCGLNCCLLRREVGERMLKAYPQQLSYNGYPTNMWFDRLADDQNYMEEDASFCRRWRDLGGEIWADLESSIRHGGTHLFECGQYGEWLHRESLVEQVESAADRYQIDVGIR